MICLPIEILPVAQTKVDGGCVCCAQQAPTFVSVLLTNHYSISLLICFYCTLRLVLALVLQCSNISISPDQRKAKEL